MKELSIEEKAKAYDEAFEKIKIWQEHLYDVGDKDYADELNYIFPELAESEDERIRKEIIDFVKSRGGFKGDWIAWLEKQGEQKPAEKTTWYDNVDDLIADAMIDDIKNADMPEHCKNNRLTWINKHRSKPAEWSKEDEEISEAIIKRIKGESEALSVSLSSAVSWVGNIKDRVQPQSHWKPSDKQMKALEDTFVALGGYDNSLRSLINDLKSLK